MNSAWQRVIIHISGTDKPGVTSSLCASITRGHAKLIDIGQSVLHGFLTLSAIVDLPPGSSVLHEIMLELSKLGLRIEVSPLQDNQQKKPQEHHKALCITLLGDLSTGYIMSEVTALLSQRALNIRDIKTLSEGHLSGLELIVDSTLGEMGLKGIREELILLSNKLKVDISFQYDDIFRRNKRLVCLDVDSTFVQMEVIDELAALRGCKEEVAKITEAAMAGQLDFKQALTQRVKLLNGLPFKEAQKLLNNVPFTPGIDTLVKVLKSLGYRVGLVSGGFDFFVNDLKNRFHLDFAFANQLEVENGFITGNIIGSIVDAERKAQILRDMAQIYKCRIEQTIAIGDGANDADMLRTAGLGIAYRGKPVLQKVADFSSNNSSMSDLLYLLGIKASDINKVLY